MTTVGKDGKVYSGKKRGRKSAADKEREALEQGADPDVLKAIAQAVNHVPEEKKKSKKVRVFREVCRLCHRPLIASEPFGHDRARFPRHRSVPPNCAFGLYATGLRDFNRIAG